jgi:hypothetical protein
LTQLINQFGSMRSPSNPPTHPPTHPPNNPIQRISRAIAGTHLAQWNAVKAILSQEGLTFDSPNLPIARLLPALKSGVAAAAKTVLVDGQFIWSNAQAAIDALYNSQVDPTQTAAINLGVAAGQAVITLRTNDGFPTVNGNFMGTGKALPPFNRHFRLSTHTPNPHTHTRRQHDMRRVAVYTP